MRYLLLLCTKPNQAEQALKQLAEGGAKNGLLISVAAGLSLSWLQNTALRAFELFAACLIPRIDG